jgi:hypothetical protein
MNTGIPKETIMRTPLRSLMLTALAVAASASMPLVPASAAEAPAAATAPAAASARYSVATTPVGQLLDNPAANEVLKKLIPTVYANDMFQTAGRELTLKAIQQYEPDALSEANLAKIQAELDKIPVKA